MAAKCWEIRPCDKDMQGHCAHADLRERCPTKCHFATCWSKKHEILEDPFSGLIGLDVTDEWPVKEECLSCSFFVTSNNK